MNQARIRSRTVGSVLLVGIAMFGTIAAFARPDQEVPGESNMDQSCHDEVVQLHQFFQDWFNASIPASDEAFQRFSKVMGEGFAIISPGGQLTQRAELLQRLGNAYGIWSEREPAGRIWIENLSTRTIAGGQALVTYEEWQDSGDGPRGRLSTALLKIRKDSPNGLEWLHVHEVWLPE